MKGIFFASRMRATIWPTRPKPAMTTWPSFSGMASKARATTAFGARVSSISSSSGVAAIDRVTATDRRSATGCSIMPEAAPVGEQPEGELAALGDGERQPPRRAGLTRRGDRGGTTPRT